MLLNEGYHYEKSSDVVSPADLVDFAIFMGIKLNFPTYQGSKNRESAKKSDKGEYWVLGKQEAAPKCPRPISIANAFVLAELSW